jgi:two-component system chemotaxis response regulator CheB
MSAGLAASPADRVRVMVVDDSVVARSVATRWLGEQPGFEVVATCRSGAEALSKVVTSTPDVVLLDVEMPGMDGLEALPLLLKARPGLVVLMNSSFTTRGAELSLRCLALGATDVLAKPTAEAFQAGDYRLEFVARLEALGEIARRRRAVAPRIRGQARASVVAASVDSRVDCIAIGCSTGGPQALMDVFRSLGGRFDEVPVLVTQHMPAGFTAALGEHLSRGTGVTAREAVDREALVPGHVYIAPGGRHLSVMRGGAGVVARLDDGPPVNFCKPSVDPMFRSASKVYGAGLVAVVLTGMGSDGASAAAAVAAAGGRVIAQDEATSVVWGMPGAAVATGACMAVLPVRDIGPKLARMIQRGRS